MSDALQTFLVWAPPGGRADLMTGTENYEQALQHPDNKGHVLVARLAVASLEEAQKVYAVICDIDPAVLHSPSARELQSLLKRS